jgi:hydroxyacylglutathione hydrolase
MNNQKIIDNAMLNIIPVPAFKDNYIWLLHNQQFAVAVDPGDAAPVQAWLSANKIKLAAILCTHHHNDHSGGICELVEVYNVPVYGPRLESIACVSHPVGEGDVVNITELNLMLDVLDIPGHTRGHIAYLFFSNSVPGLFCGDTLFGCGCGRLFEGAPAQLLHSLHRLAHLPDNTRVYCAHEYTEANIRFALVCEPGNEQLVQRQKNAHELRVAGLPTLPSTIALEKSTNPFLRCTQPEVILAAREHGDATFDDELSIFTALRSWKNGYG